MTTSIMKTIELVGPALDWAVAKCEGLPMRHDPMGFKSGSEAGYWIWDDSPKGRMEKIGRNYSPSTSWSQAGPIIHREKISPTWSKLWDQWVTPHPKNAALGILGPTFLVSVMRAYVVSKFGEEIEVPGELILEHQA